MTIYGRRTMNSLQFTHQELLCPLVKTVLERITIEKSRHTYLRERVAKIELLFGIVQIGL
jgi:hypothetical protein